MYMYAIIRALTIVWKSVFKRKSTTFINEKCPGIYFQLVRENLVYQLVGEKLFTGLNSN